MSEHLLSVKDLHTSFTTDNGEVHAVNGVSFNLDAGKVLGIVGESGSGKSVTAYSIMRSSPRTAVSPAAAWSTRARTSRNGAESRWLRSAANAVRSSFRTR